MNIISLIVGILSWLILGFTLYLRYITKYGKIKPLDLFVATLASVFGPFMLILFLIVISMEKIIRKI